MNIFNVKHIQIGNVIVKIVVNLLFETSLVFDLKG